MYIRVCLVRERSVGVEKLVHEFWISWLFGRVDFWMEEIMKLKSLILTKFNRLQIKKIFRG